MGLEAGQEILHYRLVEKIGEGGMGIVWKAVDTTLDREVAIKVLPEMLAQHPERLQRFEREAKTLAGLSHPHIATVFGLHEHEGTWLLAMELVPGENLQQRLVAGPLPPHEVLRIALHVAEALEAAHQNGVIHRDLKPANIQITPEGKAKVLDFGLAKAFEPDPSQTTASVSPTVTSAATPTTGGTVAGMVLGTAAYMSPEQARGKVVDKRTDIWSFGCVLYEALSGHSLFRGETVSDSLGAILHKEPDWTLLPPGTPPTVHLLLRRCLAKDRDTRLHDIADARIELYQAIADPTSTSLGIAVDALAAAEARTRTRRSPGWLLPAVAAGALAVGLLAGWAIRGGAPEPPLRKLDLGARLAPDEETYVALDPRGTEVAFLHQGKVWIQRLDELEPRAIEGTDGALAPFWSPDGQEIGYLQGQRLWRVSTTGARPVSICDVGGEIVGGRGGSWGEDGTIVFARGGSGILRVDARGGAPTEIIPTDEDEGDLHEPQLLPDGRGILFVAHPEGQGPGELWLWADGERRLLLDLTGDNEFIQRPFYDASGHILFRRDGGQSTNGLWAVPFSLDDLKRTGEPFLVEAAASGASVSRDGTLVFIRNPPGSRRSQLYWLDRSGEPVEPIGEPAAFIAPGPPSPDSRLLPVGLIREGQTDIDVWMLDLERGVEMRITSDPAAEFPIVWLPSGELVYFVFEGAASHTMATVADGSRPPRRPSDRLVFGALADGRLVTGERTDAGVKRLFLERPGEEPDEPFFDRGTRVSFVSVSPGGRFLAYVTDQSGRDEVYLTRLPSGEGQWQVSLAGGDGAKWDPRGDRLYYVEGHTLMEVTVADGDREPRLGRPTRLFDIPGTQYAVSRDGQRFAVPRPVVEQGESPGEPGIKVIESWRRELSD